MIIVVNRIPYSVHVMCTKATKIHLYEWVKINDTSLSVYGE